MSIVEKAW